MSDERALEKPAPSRYTGCEVDTCPASHDFPECSPPAAEETSQPVRSRGHERSRAPTAPSSNYT